MTFQTSPELAQMIINLLDEVPRRMDGQVQPILSRIRSEWQQKKPDELDGAVDNGSE